MTADSSGKVVGDPSFQSLLVSCLERLERGEPLDREQLLKQHPKFAGPLEEFLNNQAMLRDVASSVRESIGKAAKKARAIQAIEETLDSRSDASAPVTGDVIRYVGEYEILQEIARGGMGVVFQARHRKLNRTVALKMILSGRLAADADVERFVREAQAAARLKHPHIVAVHEVGRHEGHHYFTMDFISGHSLAEKLRDEPLPPRQAAELVRTIAEAVDFAHQQGTLHRDLKPANILIDADGQPHITDFGLAKMVGPGEASDELTETGQVLGTPSYMSPEQAAGKSQSVGPATDVYSLGAVLYASLTGRAPFVADSALDTLAQVVRNEPAAPRTLNAKVPKDLETICLQCLAKEPHHRYGTAQLLADDLERYLMDRPIRARPIGPVARAWRWCRRNQSVALLLVFIGVALTLGTAISLHFAVQARHKALSANREAAIAKRNFRQMVLAKGKAEDLAAQLQVALKESREQKQVVESALEETEEARAAEKDAREQTELLLYATQIASAKREWETNHAAAAWHYLHACRKAFRGWEYDYLQHWFTHGQLRLDGHAHGVTSVAFSPDGKRVATGSRTDGNGLGNETAVGKLTLWDAERGRALFSVDAHEYLVTDVAFGPAGKCIFSCGADRFVKVWDAQNGEALHVMAGHTAPVNSISVSPDGKRIASGGRDQTLRTWSVEEGNEIFAIDTFCRVRCVAFSPDGKRIATGGIDGQCELTLWDAETGQRLLALDSDTPVVNSVAFAPDGDRLVSGGTDENLSLWDLTSGTRIHVLEGHTSNVNSLAFSPDGQFIVSGSSDGLIKVWDATEAREVCTLTGHTEAVSDVEFSPDGRRIASASRDRSARIWDTKSKPPDFAFEGHSAWVRTLAYSIDGKRMASGGDDKTVKVWSVDTGQMIDSLEHTEVVTSVTFSPGGHRVVAGDRNGLVTAWNLEDRLPSLKIEAVTRGHVFSVAISPDGRRIASGGMDNRLKIWDAASGRELQDLGHPGGVYSIAFSPDGKRIASGSYGTARVWNMSDGRLLCSYDGHHKQTFVKCIGFSPDGANIVSGSADGMIKVWDSEDGHDLLTLTGHRGAVGGVTFSPDAKRIASGGWDGTLKIWDAHRGQELLSLNEYSGRSVTCIAFSPDGKQIATGGESTTVTLRRAGASQAEHP